MKILIKQVMKMANIFLVKFKCKRLRQYLNYNIRIVQILRSGLFFLILKFLLCITGIIRCFRLKL